jgi:sulfate permease, SulP family
MARFCLARRTVLTVADRIDDLKPVVIVRLRHMTAIDASGLLALEEFADKLRSAGRVMLLCGARPQPAKLMKQAEFERHIGKNNICPDIDTALNRAVLHYIATSVTGKISHRTNQPAGAPR